MVRNRCQGNILQIFEENHCIFIFYLPINFKFLQDAISGIIFYIHMLPVNLFLKWNIILIKCYLTKLIKLF